MEGSLIVTMITIFGIMDYSDGTPRILHHSLRILALQIISVFFFENRLS